jgi:hypothetical protein
MSEIDHPYEARCDSSLLWYVNGPSDGGLSYYGGTLWPTLRFGEHDDKVAEVNAKRATEIANEAYRQGYIRAQADIRTALGL